MPTTCANTTCFMALMPSVMRSLAVLTVPGLAPLVCTNFVAARVSLACRERTSGEHRARRGRAACGLAGGDGDAGRDGWNGARVGPGRETRHCEQKDDPDPKPDGDKNLANPRPEQARNAC